MRDKQSIDDLGETIYDWGMYIGKVSGTVVATIKHAAFNGRKLLIVDKLGEDGQPAGGYDICVDTVQAGVGDTVLVLDEGNGARQVLNLKTAPIRAVIVGIVDDVSWG
ncbi:MAG: EutN/CcmL family microcompartment protein [Candidatus Promineifilaceae bacterium]|jgi:microcompartment protein CcmK/EutM